MANYLTRIVLFFTLLPAILFSQPSKGSSLANWLYREQVLINRTVDETKIIPPDIANQAEAYRPDSQTWFDLPSVWVPEQALKVANLEKLIPETVLSDLQRVRNKKKEYRLFIHPESKTYYNDFLAKYPAVIEHKATATSSSRSLLVESKTNPAIRFFAKLSLDVKLGGVSRTISQGEVARSVGVTKYFTEHESKIDSNYKIIPEVLGISPKEMQRGGQIIRLIPPEVQNGKNELVPLFSLYARPSDGSLTLLEQLAKNENLTPFEFAKDKIVNPFLKGWASWAISGGLVTEAHAQNILVEISRNGKSTGNFYLRDGGGIYVRPNVSSIGKGELAQLPTFHSYLWDHQKWAESAETSSLATYFIGGFLYNIDKELKRIDPNYRKGTVEQYFWKTLANEISSMSGIPIRSLTRTRMENDMEGVLKDAREKVSGESYRPLSYGLGRPLRIGIYSGTFDPPHKGHEILLENAQKQHSLDIIYIAPNYQTPHKKDVSPFKTRKEMAIATFNQIGNYVVEGELEKAGRVKGPDGIMQRLLKKFDPDTQFYRIIGQDSLRYYENEGEKYTHPNITFLVGPRANESKHAFAKKIGQSTVEPLEFYDPEYSSTQIRKSLEKGEVPSNITAEVMDIIIKNKLYGTGNSKINCQKTIGKVSDH